MQNETYIILTCMYDTYPGSALGDAHANGSKSMTCLPLYQFISINIMTDASPLPLLDENRYSILRYPCTLKGISSLSSPINTMYVRLYEIPSREFCRLSDSHNNLSFIQCAKSPIYCVDSHGSRQSNNVETATGGAQKGNDSTIETRSHPIAIFIVIARL